MLTGDLVPGADAPGTHVEPDNNAINIERRRLNIRKPGSPGVLFGVADPVAETQRFPTHITFDSQFKTSSIDTLLFMSKNDI